MSMPDDVQLEVEDDDMEDDDEMVQMLMDSDYETGEAVKGQIIPFAVRWYTGEARPEDDDDDDEEEEEPMPKKKGGKKPASKAKGDAKPATDAEKKEECKQQ